MDIIKFSVDETTHYKIERDLFEEKTKGDERYYSDPSNKEEGSHYAVCPSCNNPVQIVGLFKKIKHTDKPYARHYEKDIKNLAVSIKANYDYCPLKATRVKHKEHAKHKEMNPMLLEIVKRLVTQFDKVVYFLEKQTQIGLYENFLREMLKDYFYNKGYLYYDSSLINIPIKFAHAACGSGNYRLFGRIIFNQELKEAILKELPNAKFKGNQFLGTENRRINVNFSFILHKLYHQGESLHETITLSVHYVRSEGELPTAIYEKVIKFDPDYYINLVNYDENKLSEKQREKNLKLIELAKSVAYDFGFTFDD